MELLAKLNDDGTTIVMVTHSQRDASYAHRIVNMLDGYLVEQTQVVFHVLDSAYFLISRATFSTWWVWGNMSTGWISTTRYLASSIAMSRAWVAGLQLT